MTRVLSKAGIPVPPVPQRYAHDLQTRGELCFSTRPINPQQMYMFNSYLREAGAGPVADYLAFSHAGHGVNSYAFTYQLVAGPLVLMVQALIGGIYMGRDEKQRLEALLQRSGALIEAVQRATRESLDATRGRLFVFESDFRGILVWGWREYPFGGARETRKWLDRHSVQAVDREGPSFIEAKLPTNAALNWVETRILSEPPAPNEPERRQLSQTEKDEIRRRLQGGDGVQTIARELSCSRHQVAAIKAWITIKG
ncbi:MAG: hypothetical protein ABIZ92_06325 [Vicinamibacterales bacterium]